MNHSRLHFFLFSLMSLVATSAFADETKAILPEKEEDIPVEFIPTLDTTISVGMRRLNNGPHVRFTNLGSIAQPTTGASHDVGANFTNHRYTDGYVVADGLSDYEKNAAGTQLAAGGTYSNNNWITTRTGDIVTVYTTINTAALNPDGSFVKNSDDTYVPNSTPVLNPDGTIVQHGQIYRLRPKPCAYLGCDESAADLYRFRRWKDQGKDECGWRGIGRCFA